MSTLLGPRDENGIPVPMTVDESIASMKASLLKKIKRSAYVYRVDCGGCNGCEIEIFATLSPLFDAERFGIKVVPSPRHADILLFTGAVTRAMRSPALRAWQSAPDPKICISYGACGNSGGIFHDLYCVWGGTDKIVPVDVYIPGCLPTPAATLYGFAMALGLLEQKIHARLPGELDEQPTELLHADMVQPLRVRIDREARRLAGYRYGRQIADDYMRLLGQGDSQVLRWLEAEKDPRLTEIVTHLNQVVEGGAYPMSETVVFSQLSRKFIDENDATPDQAQQVVYYSLAIGHHLGVIDCLEAALSCPWDAYLAWIATLEAGSAARRKMEGVPKYGEIVIDSSHVAMLANAFDKAQSAQTPQQQAWSKTLLSMLHDIHQESAIYLMVRRLRD